MASMSNRINPIWTGHFANLKKRWGGGRGVANWPSPNLAISSQITIKLGKDLLSVVFTN